MVSVQYLKKVKESAIPEKSAHDRFLRKQIETNYIARKLIFNTGEFCILGRTICKKVLFP